MLEEPNRPKSSFVSSVATVLGGQAVCAALGLVTEICYARLLGPAGRGQISICMMVITFGLLVGGLGAEGPIIIWSANPKNKLGEWLPATLGWGLLGCLTAVGLWVMTYWRWHPSWLGSLSASLATIVLATIPLAVLGSFFGKILAGKERFRLSAGVSFADQLAGLFGFVLLLLLWGRKPEAAMAGNVVGLAIGLALNILFLKDSFSGPWRVRWPGREIRSGFAMGLRGQLGNFASLLFYRLDVFFLNLFLGPAQVGLYALGVVVTEALWQIPSAAATALCPRTARTLDEGAPEFTCMILRQVFAISCALAILLAIACPIAIPLVFGERFRPSIAVVWWILPGTVALSLAKVACADLLGRSKVEYSTVIAIIALGVSVALDLVLIPRMGIQGAALTSSAAYITDAAFLLWALKYELKVSWKSLLVPSAADFVLYRQAWVNCSSWLRSVSLPATGAD